MVLTTVVIVGMSGNTLDFTIQFDQIDGLRNSDAVYFDKTRIGIVRNIAYTDQGDYRVDVAVEFQFASRPKYSSTYYIDADPENKERQAIRIVDLQNGGQVVKPNAVINGMSRYAALFDRITQKFRKNLRVMESEISDLFKDLQSLSEDEQIKQLENQLEKILKDIENLNSEMKHKLETEILPRIKDQLQELKNRLKKNGREEKLDDANEKLDKITAKFYI